MMLDADKIIIKDRIRKDYGDLDELARDIQENGLINPPVVTPDNVLIAGERRFLAMTKKLGWKQIEVRPMTVQDALHQLKLEISENENRKGFSFSEKMEWAERLEAELRKTAASNQACGKCLPEGDAGRVRDKVAEQVDMGSGENYRKAKYIKANADEEMIRQLDDNELSINAAYVKLKRKAEDTENRLREVEREKDELTAEMVEQQRAINASNDSESFVKMAKGKSESDEKATKALNTLEVERREHKAEIERLKANNDAQVSLLQTNFNRLTNQMADMQKALERAKNVQPEPVEIVPDDYEELKAFKQAHTSTANNFFDRFKTSSEQFLSDIEDFSLADISTATASETISDIVDNLCSIMNHCKSIINAAKNNKAA